MGKGITAKHRSPFWCLFIIEKSSTMQVLNRLKMELSNQEYFTDDSVVGLC